jgi:hypothetical protein
MASTTYGGDVVIVTINRTCAKQLLLALTLALGGTPIKQLSYGKGKGKGKGKGTGTSKGTSKGTGKATPAVKGKASPKASTKPGK